METKPLETLGLTKNEITIYKFLVRHGDSTTGPIIKETRIANSRVYESLNSLIKKGFVSYNLQKDGKHFQASDPSILIDREEERKKQVMEIVEQLSSERKKDEETTMAVYEGFDGFKTAFKKIIDDCPKGEEIKVTGFPEYVYNLENLRTFLTNMNLKSAGKKQKLKILLETSTKETLGKDRQKEKCVEIKYLPKGFVNPTAMDIFLDYVYIFLWEEKPYVFMIKNQKIANSFRSYHDALWKLSRK